MNPAGRQKQGLFMFIERGPPLGAGKSGLFFITQDSRTGPEWISWKAGRFYDSPDMEEIMDNQLFRKQSMDRISSPEKLEDYMRVTSPGIWMILTAVIVLLAGLIICASIGKVETKYPVEAGVSEGNASVLLDADTEYTVQKGMTLRIGDGDYKIGSVRRLESGETAVTADVPLPDGTYEAQIVTESITPISFLTN